MYQSTLDQIICKRIKGETDIIEYLDLSSGFISSQDLLILSKCIQSYQSTHNGGHSLVEIDLSSNQLCGVNNRGEGNYDPDGFITFCNVLQSSRIIKTLCLDRNFLSIPGCASISNLLINQSSLTQLSLKKCKISNDGGIELSKGLAANRSLTFLDLSGNMIYSIGLQHIFRSLNENKRSELKLLDLSSNAIEFEGCRYITTFLRDNNSLRALILDDNYLGAISSAAETQTSSSVPSENSSRDVEDKNVNSVDLIAEMLCVTKKLAHLSLQNNQITDVSVCLLAKSLEFNRTLTYIGLQWNTLSDIGGGYLAKGLTKNSTLMSLSLTGNSISSQRAGLIVESSTLSRGSTILPCELDIPTNSIRNQSIFQSELDSIQYDTNVNLNIFIGERKRSDSVR